MSDAAHIVETTEVRCPARAKGLLGKLVSTGKGNPLDFNDYMVQLHCSNCTKDMRNIFGSNKVLRVLHLFNIVGDFVKTQVQFRDEKEVRDISEEAQLQIMELASSFTKKV